MKADAFHSRKHSWKIKCDKSFLPSSDYINLLDFLSSYLFMLSHKNPDPGK